MNLYHLRYFVALAGLQHYTKAAEALAITQPSLSHAIALMEDELGVPLFMKSGRNVLLTHYGEEFLKTAQRTLSTLDEGVEAIRRSAGGEEAIRLGFCAPMGIDFVPRMAAGFLKTAPDVQFTFHEGDAPQLLRGLAAGEFDAIFCEEPTTTEFDAHPVCRQQWVVVTARESALAAKAEITPEELAREKLILFPKGTFSRKITDRMFESAGIQAEATYEAESKPLIAGLVAQGLGASPVLKESAQQMPKLAAVPIKTPENALPFSLIHAKRKFMSPAAQRFCKYVLAESSKKPDSSKK